MLKWFAGHQIRNVGVSMLLMFSHLVSKLRWSELFYDFIDSSNYISVHLRETRQFLDSLTW